VDNTRKVTSIIRMRIRAYNLMVLALVLLMAAIAPDALAAPVVSSEYQVKAAFLYNFIKFVDWPGEDATDSNEPVVIVVLGKNPFGGAFKPIENKQVKERDVSVKYFKGLEELEKSGEKDKAIEAIRKCQLLFICPSEEANLREIINLVKNRSVLTVADSKDFLDSGGIIEFVMDGKKVRFGINVTAAKSAKLKVRSQLLRLAKKVVGEKETNGAED